MDSRDFFRRFFGFPNRHLPDLQDEDGDDVFPLERHNNHDEGLNFSFGNSSQGLEGMFEHFHGDMWRQMGALHKQMEELMKGFGAIDFPSSFDQPEFKSLDPDIQSKPPEDKVFVWSNIPNPIFSNKKRNPRDLMLKDGTEEHQPAPPAADGRSKFDTVYPVPHQIVPGSENRKDTDLDGKVSEDKIVAMIKQSKQERQSQLQPSLDKPRLFSSGRSVTVSTIRGAGNKVEQKRTVKDSSGHEESTVTRSMGDKSYTVTTIMDKDGTQQRHEAFQNMTESDVSKFEDHWKKHHQPSTPADPMLAWPATSLDSKDRSLFYKLFAPKN